MESAAPLFLSAGMQAAFHPVAYAKVLIQLGHEPVDPVSSTSLFGKKVLVYPNVLQYIKHIKKEDGFFGMYRGIGPRITAGILAQVVSNKIAKKLKKKKPVNRRSGEIDGDDEEEEEEGLMKLFKDMGIDMLCRTSAVIVSHPFQVIMIRSMAQFVGRETVYSNSFSGIVEIYNKEGILGFFSGLIPRLIGEIASIWLTTTLTYLVTNYIIPKENKDLPGYARGICSLVTSQFTYPFTVVSNVMCINGSVVAAGRPPLMPLYSGWRVCWSQLSREHSLKRGSSLFWRYFKGPTIVRRDGSLMAANPMFIN